MSDKNEREDKPERVRCWLCGMLIEAGAERFPLRGGKFVCRPCYRSRGSKP